MAQKFKIASTSSLLIAYAVIGLVALPLAGLLLVVYGQLKNRK